MHKCHIGYLQMHDMATMYLKTKWCFFLFNENTKYKYNAVCCSTALAVMLVMVLSCQGKESKDR